MRFTPLLVLACFLFSPAASAMPEKPMLIAECKQTLASLKSLMQGQKIPDHFNKPNPRRRGDEFDPMSYFTVFPHLSMLPGEVIDYVYRMNGGGGYPLLYTRPADAAPLADAEAFDERFGKKPIQILDRIRADGSAQGWFELAAFNVVAWHFYLRWHDAARFQLFACEAADVMPFVWENEKSAAIAALQNLNLAPSVEMLGDTAVVELTLVQQQGVIDRVRLRISTAAPYRIEQESRVPLFRPKMMVPM